MEQLGLSFFARGVVAFGVTVDVDPVPPDASLVEAARQMRVGGLGAIPVLDHGGECGGIVTERDIVVRVLAEGREPPTAFVRDIATMDPVTCSAEEEVGDVVARMREHGVQHLPVCEAGEVIGVISLADIVFGRPDEERGTITPAPSVGPLPVSTYGPSR